MQLKQELETSEGSHQQLAKSISRQVCPNPLKIPSQQSLQFAHYFSWLHLTRISANDRWGPSTKKKIDNGLWIVDQPGSANVLRCTLVNQFRPLASNKDWIISGDDLASSLERLPCQPCQASPTLGSWATEAKSPRFVSIKIAPRHMSLKGSTIWVELYFNVYECLWAWELCQLCIWTLPGRFCSMMGGRCCLPLFEPWKTALVCQR